MNANKLFKLTNEELIYLLDKANSISEFLRNMEYSTSTGGGYKVLRDECKRRNIDLSFYKNKYKNVNGNYNLDNKKIEIKDILIENSTYQNRSRLKVRLVRENILEYKCSECENNGLWNGRKLSLQLNHKNGINNDNRVENLEFLCPNCHSQTNNYAGKNKKQ